MPPPAPTMPRMEELRNSESMVLRPLSSTIQISHTSGTSTSAKAV